MYCPKCGESIQLVPDYDELEEELLSKVVEDKDKSKKKNEDDKIDEDKKLEATGENQDITVDTNDSVSEETVDAIPDGVNISTSEPVGHNVDVKL